MLITISCAPIGQRRNNVGDLIGAKNTKGKECCSNVSSRLWGGALRDDTKNGCEGDYFRRGNNKDILLYSMLAVYGTPIQRQALIR